MPGRRDPAVIAPDAPILVSGGEDGLKVWDAGTGALLRSLAVPAVESLAFSPDGRALAAAHGELFTLVDTATWEESDVLKAKPDWIARALTFSPDGRQLAWGGMLQQVHLRDVAGRKELAVLKGHVSRVSAVAWSARANLLATAEECQTDGTGCAVIFWDMNTREEVGRLPQVDGVNALAFSPDGRLLAVGEGGLITTELRKSIQLWDVRSRTLRGLLQGHDWRIDSLAFTPSGETLYSSDGHEAVVAWDVRTACYLTLFEDDKDPLWSLAFSPDGRLMAAGNHGGRSPRLDARRH